MNYIHANYAETIGAGYRGEGGKGRVKERIKIKNEIEELCTAV